MFGVPYTITKPAEKKVGGWNYKAALARVKKLKEAQKKTKAQLAKAGKSKKGGSSSADCKKCCGNKLAQLDSDCMEDEDSMFAQFADFDGYSLV